LSIKLTGGGSVPVKLVTQRQGSGLKGRKTFSGTDLKSVLKDASRHFRSRVARRLLKQSGVRLLLKGMDRTLAEEQSAADRLDLTVRPARRTVSSGPLGWLHLAASPDRLEGALRRSHEKWKQKRAAGKITRVAREHGQRRGVAASTLKRILKRRCERKRDMAVRLLQWTWRRRRGLIRQCSLGSQRKWIREAPCCNPNQHGIRWPMLRPVPRCLYGTNLASTEDFAAQKALSDAVLAHWGIYSRIFQRLEKNQFLVGDLCCSEGGQSLGAEALGCSVKGMDIIDQPRWKARFGEDNFVLGSVLSEKDLNTMGFRHGYVCSPPCQGGSSMPHAGGGLTDSKEPMIIDKVRRLLDQSGRPYILENVMGTYAQGHMRKDVCLKNHDMGLRAYRPRVFEANFPIVKEPELDARKLSRRCCLGGTSRMPRLDNLGRKFPFACCNANHVGVYSTPCNGVTVADWEAAMGVEPGLMSARGLALAIPPAFTQ
jgi:hypothetical protein